MTDGLAFGSGDGSRDAVNRALGTGESLPGTGGFAGLIDGHLVRDVLGRVPLFVDGVAMDGSSIDGHVARTSLSRGRTIATDRRSATVDAADWSRRPTALDDPIPVPSGTVDLEPRWTLPEPAPVDDRGRIVNQLDQAITDATRRQATGAVGVAFSGGLDSALLAAHLDAPLYTVGFPDSHDVEAAQAAAEALGRRDDLTVIELSIDDVERAVPIVARAIGRTNAMDVAIATSLYLVADAAASDGAESLVIGQGADELFGGYEKIHRLDHRVESDTKREAVRELLASIPEQLSRDVLAVEAGGVRPVTPYLHDDVVATALRLPAALYGTETTRKRALRHVAREYLPESIADRRKKAFQYGSLVSRELDRLARQAGYKRRMDDHVRRYVESRL
ncbi:asparagine synthase C-terminal domain-containing protein [Halovivax cerinus]|uniref:Asparagine synthase C-terminal domain-containing protein n=1 Tax=Halovivax cerinus TaxID=1487865 RepID=A0ABD5NJS6_9EURY|nr:asparagine synthase-related protein [Halovivax cerinus]